MKLYLELFITQFRENVLFCPFWNARLNPDFQRYEEIYSIAFLYRMHFD